MESSSTAFTPSESYTSLWISVTAHVPIYISLNCAANQPLIRPASKRATSPPNSTTILLTRPKMVKTTTTPLNLRRSINLCPHLNLLTFSHPPSEFTTPPPPSAKKASWYRLQQSMFQQRQASKLTTRCLFREHMLVPWRARRFNHRLSIMALLHSRDRHIAQTRGLRVHPLAPGYQNPRWDGSLDWQKKNWLKPWVGADWNRTQKRKIPCVNTFSSRSHSLGICFVLIPFSIHLNIFIILYWCLGGQDVCSLVPLVCMDWRL